LTRFFHTPLLGQQIGLSAGQFDGVRPSGHLGQPLLGLVQLAFLLRDLRQTYRIGQGGSAFVVTDVDLAALEVSLDQARSLTAALKTSRAQKPDRDDRPRAVKDSPFAALSALTATPAPTRAKRKRPRRTRAPG
jgi:hypothetical protein